MLQPDLRYVDGEYKDVTAELLGLAKQLDVSELAKSPAFQLLDGVSALEIGNERMDTGLLYKPLDESLKQLPKLDSADTVLQLMDLCFGVERAWQNGASLIQSVFSCAYIETILAGHNAGAPLGHIDFAEWRHVFNVWAVAMLKNIGQSLDIMMHGGVIEEEDIVFQTFQMNLFSTTGAREIESLLESAIEWVQTQKNDVSDAIIARLRLRKEITQLGALTLARKLDGSISAAKKARDMAQKLSVSDTDVSALEKSFTNEIQGRVQNDAPPRDLVRMKPSEAVADFVKAMDELIECGHVASVTTSAEFLGFMVKFSALNTKPFTRAYMHTHIIDGEQFALLGKPVREWVVKDMVENTCATGWGQYVLSTADSAVSELTASFLAEADMAYSDLFGILVLNRSRQRQVLSHAVVTWDGLQVMAENLETQLEAVVEPDKIDLGSGNKMNAMPITSWVMLRKLQVMIWTALLGFELDVYKLHEWGFMSWYCEYLSLQRKQYLERVRYYLCVYADNAQMSQTFKKNKKKGKKGASVVKSVPTTMLQLEDINKATMLTQSMTVESSALADLCKCSMLLMYLYDRFGLIQHPQIKYTSADLMYGLRLKPFSSVGVPALVNYSQFKESTTDQLDALSVDDIFAIATRTTGELKKMVDAVVKQTDVKREPQVQLLQRSTMGISINLAALKMKKEVVKEYRVEVVKEGYHLFFPVPSMKRVATE
ncbi:N-alpha-acetyltransferase, 35 NatC auxiliary subunit [Yarrowia sp. E02]|nr:N-alpha-acetyltransferase, 35 NatC auxiliary subunit [Yarrowia sp. E02]